MQLVDSICILKDENENYDKLFNTLAIAKTIMSITIPMPSVDWKDVGQYVVVVGTEQELAIIKQVMQVNLGVFYNGATENPNVPQPVASDGAGVIRPVTEDRIISVDFAARDVLSPFAYNPVNCNTVNQAVVNSDGEAVLVDSSDPLAINVSSGLSVRGEPDYVARRSFYESELADSIMYRHSTELIPSARTHWQLTYERLTDAPNPTESASGSYTREEQIRFSEEHNPRHWNLVKVTYNGSRRYLSYICPPAIDMESTLHIVGGIHANDHPDIQEVCVYNTEPYWRELRHLMHQDVEYLREAV